MSLMSAYGPKQTCASALQRVKHFSYFFFCGLATMLLPEGLPTSCQTVCR